MMEYCPKCEREILPYLKTNELKQIDWSQKDAEMVLLSYQLYICISCRIVYYTISDTYKLRDLYYEKTKSALVLESDDVIVTEDKKQITKEEKK